MSDRNVNNAPPQGSSARQSLEYLMMCCELNQSVPRKRLQMPVLDLKVWNQWVRKDFDFSLCDQKLEELMCERRRLFQDSIKDMKKGGSGGTMPPRGGP